MSELVARTEPKERVGLDNGGHFYFEWRVRKLGDDEYRDLLDRQVIFGADRGKRWLLEKRRVDKDKDGTEPWEWTKHSFGKTKQEAIEQEGSTDYFRAKSLDPDHKALIERREALEKHEEEEQKLKYKLGDLHAKYEQQYHDELKKQRLFAKAMQDQAPKERIATIRAPFTEAYQRDSQALLSQLKGVRRDLQRLRKPTAGTIKGR